MVLVYKLVGRNYSKSLLDYINPEILDKYSGKYE